MAARGVQNISYKLNVIAQNLKRAPRPVEAKFRGKRKQKDPMEIYQQGIGSRLPEAYFKWNRIGYDPPAIHWSDKGVDWVKDPVTGDRRRVNRIPVPVYHPPESQFGLWGGEGFVTGYRKSRGTEGVRIKKTWKPFIITRKFYSEILDREFELSTTARVLDLIDEAYGFDFYLLKTPAEELNSLFGMILKRHLLLRLANIDELHPNDPEKRTKIYKKYTKFVVPQEEAEWVGLTPAEAFAKQRDLERQVDPVESLQKVYEAELVAKLREQKGDELYTFTQEEQEKATPFLQRFFGSGTKSKTGRP